MDTELKVLGIISQKGGPGKTMLATNLSIAALLAGHSVVVIDTDPQCSATRWWDKRKKSGIGERPYVIAAPAPRIKHLLDVSKDNGATFAFIDTGPNVESPVLDAARAASFILIPSRPADVDIEAIQPTMDVVKMAEKPSRVVFNAVKPGSNIGTEAQATAKDMELTTVPFEIGERLGFVRAFNNGKSILETEPKSNSAREIQRLFRYLEKEMEATDVG